MSNEKKRNLGGRPQSEVWKHFEKTPLKSAGHFSAKCTYCTKYWPRGTPNELEAHLANDCKDVSEYIRSFYLGVVSARNFGNENASLSNSNKKRKTQNLDQREITEWCEPTTLPSSKIASITRALLRAFVCCGIPFSVIQNPFFIEFLNEIRPGYEPPTDELLSGRLLSEETSRINKKVDVIIKNSSNLTLALDGWTSPTGTSIYNYIILTPDREQYLYALHDYSSDHHTGEFLANGIADVIEKIGPKKITALVTDNAANCVKAREIISSQYPNIINIRCIAHFVNLITKDIMGHDFAKQTIKSCNQIASFFKKSHTGGRLLADAAFTLKIKGGSLKSYCETRWTSMYETTNSVSRLQAALETVLLNNPNDITSKAVKKYIRSLEFFGNVNKLTEVLKPIKTAITLLESANTNLSDCFIQLILLANAIKKLPSQGMMEFHQHCIKAFNKRWANFDPKLYILAYFLHPGYRATGLKIEYWKIITTTAAQIWQNNGGDKRSCDRLLAQMRNYELRREPYDQEFDRQLETPMSWWLSIKDKYDHLCWLYGKRRQRLGLSRVEAMAKIRSFYISNIRAELVYASQKHIVDELHEMVNDSVFLQFENVDESETASEPLEIPNHEVQVLIIEKFIDLKKTVRELDDENSDTSASDSEIDSSSVDDNYSEDDSDNENDNLEVETDGYNIEELTNKYLLDNEDTL
ncbi:ribonuclease H-like domain-containing protein [Rhizophagus irregularis DAOM 181602=DAOM 197198]|nr:ribonuclease H-like domain-containing protein [Rhizophagus irregularis DAOM 181602=DAOM 197198]